jgi:hypothetical protein
VKCDISAGAAGGHYHNASALIITFLLANEEYNRRNIDAWEDMFLEVAQREYKTVHLAYMSEVIEYS